MFLISSLLHDSFFCFSGFICFARRGSRVRYKQLMQLMFYMKLGGESRDRTWSFHRYFEYFRFHVVHFLGREPGQPGNRVTGQDGSVLGEQVCHLTVNNALTIRLLKWQANMIHATFLSLMDFGSTAWRVNLSPPSKFRGIWSSRIHQSRMTRPSCALDVELES